MKFFTVCAVLFAVALAAPRYDAKVVQPESHNFVAETSDGAYKAEEGKLKNEEIVVQVSYSWVDEKTGEKFTVNYVSDEFVLQPKGTYLPKA